MVNDGMEDIVIIGFGGHAKSVADSIVSDGKYNIAGYTDVEDRGCNYHYFGTDDALMDCFKCGIHNAVLGVGYLGESSIRDIAVRKAKEIGFEFPVISDPSATVALDVTVGEGSFIGKNAVVNAESKVGRYCIINTGAIIEHECIVDDYSHVSVGTILCGKVSVGHHTMVGAGTTIIQCRKIGSNCLIGANSTVLTDIGDNMRMYGIVR